MLLAHGGLCPRSCLFVRGQILKGKNLAQMSEFDDDDDVEEEVKAPPAKLPAKQASSGLFGGSVGGLTLKPKVGAGLPRPLRAHSNPGQPCLGAARLVCVEAGSVSAWCCKEGKASAGLGAAENYNQDGDGDCGGRIRLLGWCEPPPTSALKTRVARQMLTFRLLSINNLVG